MILVFFIAKFLNGDPMRREGEVGIRFVDLFMAGGA